MYEHERSDDEVVRDASDICEHHLPKFSKIAEILHEGDTDTGGYISFNDIFADLTQKDMQGITEQTNSEHNFSQ